MDNMRPVLVVGGALLALAVLLAGCMSVAAQKKGGSKSRSLTLFAFNYTDRYLMNITVDGMWMGGASAYTNGKSALGPRPPRNRAEQHTVDVAWEISASYYDLETNKYVEDGELVRKSATIPIKFPYPTNPEKLVLHFYPNGRVEVELTDATENVFHFRRIPIPEGHLEHGRL